MDESGFLMAPVVQRTQAPRGCTPHLFQAAAHRRKVSVAAALCSSPRRRHLRLFWQSFPDGFVNAESYVAFLEDLLHEIAGPVILLQDRATFHRGESLAELLAEVPRLQVEWFPPYAPELNPPEFLWKHLKVDQMANFAPLDLDHLVATVHRHLVTVANDPERLESFLDLSDLRW